MGGKIINRLHILELNKMRWIYWFCYISSLSRIKLSDRWNLTPMHLPLGIGNIEIYFVSSSARTFDKIFLNVLFLYLTSAENLPKLIWLKYGFCINSVNVRTSKASYVWGGTKLQKALDITLLWAIWSLVRQPKFRVLECIFPPMIAIFVLLR